MKKFFQRGACNYSCMPPYMMPLKLTQSSISPCSIKPLWLSLWSKLSGPCSERVSVDVFQSTYSTIQVSIAISCGWMFRLLFYNQERLHKLLTQSKQFYTFPISMLLHISTFVTGVKNPNGALSVCRILIHI